MKESRIWSKCGRGVPVRAAKMRCVLRNVRLSPLDRGGSAELENSCGKESNKKACRYLLHQRMKFATMKESPVKDPRKRSGSF